MKSCMLIALILATSRGNVDILIPETGQVPIVGWTDNSRAYLMYCEEPHQPVSLSNSCQSISLSLHETPDSDPVLLTISGEDVGWNSSTYFNVFNLPGLTAAASRELFADEFFPPSYCSWYSLPVLPRYVSDEENRKMFLVMNTGSTDRLDPDVTWMTTVSLDPWSSSVVNTADTTTWQLGNFAESSGLSELIPEGSLPMFCVGISNWWQNMGPNYYGVHSLYNEADTLKQASLFGYFGEASADPEVLSSGYSQTDQIALWTDSAGVIWCSSFISSPASPDNSVLEISHSELPFAAALTKTRDDTGILLAWYDGSGIMVRHWQGEWNDHAHIVEPWAHVSPGNIAVCSDTDGYWVAWKDDTEPVPQYRFISRNTVTGIDDTQGGSSNEVQLAISENPVTRSTRYSISLPVNARYSVCLFDLYGRNLEEISSGEGGHVEGLLDLSGYPAGIYNVVLRTEQGVFSVRVLKTVM
jgi:hypothetical protein